MPTPSPASTTPYILGVSTTGGAAALLRGPHIVAAAPASVFGPVQGSFPEQAVAYCLAEAGIAVDELALIACYGKPGQAGGHLLRYHMQAAPWELPAFLRAVPAWLRGTGRTRRHLRQGLQALGPFDVASAPLVFPAQALCRAAQAFYPSPFTEAAVLTLEAEAAGSAATLGRGQGTQLDLIQAMPFPDAIEAFYRAGAWFLGLESDLYQLQDLAAYADPKAALTRRFQDLIETQLLDLKPDGSLRLAWGSLRTRRGGPIAAARYWARRLGIPRRSPQGPLSRAHAHLAQAIQTVATTAVVQMARALQELSGASALCLSGHPALQGAARPLLADTFERVWLPPALGGAGEALGAAWAAAHLYLGMARPERGGQDGLQPARWGPAPSPQALARRQRRYPGPVTAYPDAAARYLAAAQRLTAGEVIGWEQGRLVVGPHPQGSRCLLADPRRPDILHRLGAAAGQPAFQPLEMVILAEAAPHWVEQAENQPYRQGPYPLLPQHRLAMPAGSSDWDLPARLAWPRGPFPAVTHVDYHLRLQTVGPDDDPCLRALLAQFQALTGCPALARAPFGLAQGDWDAQLHASPATIDYVFIEHLGFGPPHAPA